MVQRARQNSVEASTFGSRFTATKTAIELIDSLRYKLRMLGDPIEGPSTNVFCDNEAVCKNTTKLESILKKEASNICLSWDKQSLPKLLVDPRKAHACISRTDLPRQ
jgi:hypothetical protein